MLCARKLLDRVLESSYNNHQLEDPLPRACSTCATKKLRCTADANNLSANVTHFYHTITPHSHKGTKISCCDTPAAHYRRAVAAGAYEQPAANAPASESLVHAHARRCWHSGVICAVKKHHKADSSPCTGMCGIASNLKGGRVLQAASRLWEEEQR